MGNLNTHRSRLALMVCLFLIVTTVAVFWHLQHHEFVNYDDDLYVTENRHVQAGLTAESVIWAFTTSHATNWHPLTWLSHMSDYELYGLNPKGHHLSNLLFHVVSTILLFLVFRRMTGALWRSSLVAALFALHPLHVESVAWVSERKDVLSTFFWMLTMWTYLRYVEDPRLHRYLLVFFTFSAGLMSKPMLVTLPFVLLLIDYWPLGRFQIEQSGDAGTSKKDQWGAFRCEKQHVFYLIWEKVPFFALSAVSSIVTFLAQQKGGAVSSLVAYPLSIRIVNALVSYVGYMGKTVWPHGLAVFYPHPDKMLPMWQVAAAGLSLVLISVIVIRVARRFPYVPVGWLWYLGTLVPVIGLVQVGSHAMADRYTYIPLIGLFIIPVWGLFDLGARWLCGRVVLTISTVGVLSAFMIATWLQVGHWKDSITLFEHALDVTANNPVAHNNLGIALELQGKVDAGVAHYSEALEIKPDFAEAHNNLGSALDAQGRLDEAAIHYSKALQIKPDFAEAHNNWGGVLDAQGKVNEAMAHYSEALRIKPDFIEAHNNLGIALARQGKVDEAMAHYSEALEIKPDFAEGHNNLGIVLAVKGNLSEAVVHFCEAIRLQPTYAEAHKNLGFAYWLLGDMDSALNEHRILEDLDVDLAEELLALMDN